MQKKIITFYSYKGGVGRTMALANAACQLANKHGLDVIAVDWDLEAPGLHYYFDFNDQELAEKPGLIDYLYDFVEEVKKGRSGNVPNLSKYLIKPKQHILNKIKNGSVTLLTCGMTNQSYMSRVQNFNWAKFYEDFEGYQIIETLKKQLLDFSDVALIDSRAGQADISSTSTIQIPDALLFFFTSNKQSLEGTANLAKKLKKHPFRINQGFDDIRMLMIPSRVFSEDDRFDHWIKSVANPIFDELVKHGVIAKEDQPKGLLQCVLGIEPRFTFKEELPVLDDSYIQSSLKVSYEHLAYAITDLLEGRRLWSSQRNYPFQLGLSDKNMPEISYSRNIEMDGDAKAEADKLKNEVSAASDRGDDHRSAYLRYKLGQVLVILGKIEEAETQLEASLTYNKSRGFSDAVSAIEYSLGNLKLKTDNYTEAIRHFNESIIIDKALKNLAGECSALYQIGLAKFWMSLYDDALIAFKTVQKYAIKLKVKFLEGQAYNTIALTYYAKENYPLAIKYLNKYINFCETNNDNMGTAIAYFALGTVKHAQKQYLPSINYYEIAAAVFLRLDDYNRVIDCYDNIGEIYLLLTENKKALTYYKKAVESAKQFCSASEVITSLINLSETYYIIKNKNMAKKTINDALNTAILSQNSDAIKNITELKYKYENM